MPPSVAPRPTMSQAASPRARNRVFLVDDHPLVREGLTQLINQESDLCVCAEAEAAAAAFDGIVRTRPDAVVVDLSLQGESGFELIKRLQGIQPRPPSVLVLSMHDEEHYAERALRAGALGYVMKRETSGNVIAALRKVLSGQIYVSAAMEKQAAEKFLHKGAAGGGSPAGLPHRPRARGVPAHRPRAGKPPDRRGAGAQPQDVQTHCANIKEKLGFENATMLMREAVRWVENRP